MRFAAELRATRRWPIFSVAEIVLSICLFGWLMDGATHGVRLTHGERNFQSRVPIVARVRSGTSPKAKQGGSERGDGGV